MELNKNDLKKNLEISKVWNELLCDTVKAPSNPVNIDNYIFKLKLLVESNTKQSNNNKTICNLIDKCNNFIIQNTNLKEYLNDLNKQNSNNLEKKVELIEILDCSLPKEIQKVETKSPEKTKIVQKPEPLFQNGPNIQLDEILIYLNSIKDALNKENLNLIKTIITDISSKLNLESIKIFCINFIDLNNLNSSLVYTNLDQQQEQKISLAENELGLFFDCLIELNCLTTILSYNLSSTYLKFIFYNYLKTSLKSNEDAIQSRKILNLSSNLCKQFTKQFIFTSLVPFIIDSNQNKKLNDYVFKIAKDCLFEQDLLLSLQCLLNDYSNLNWSENVYSILSVLNDKISCLNLDMLNSILTKMKSDSTLLNKSIIFSKFLISILNKNKNYLLDQNQKLITLIEEINENNQTFYKKTVLNLIKSLKS